MRLRSESLSIFEKAVILKLTIGHPGNSAKLGKDKYEVKSGTADESAEAKEKAKARTRAEKKLLEAPEIDEASAALEKTRIRIRKIANDSPLGAGSHLISIVAVPKAEEIIKEALDRLETVHKPKIADLYPQRIAEAKRDLNGLFDPTDYAPLDDFLRKFYIDQMYLAFGAPAALASVGLLEREETRINEAAMATADAIPLNLATEMQELTKRLIARTSKSASGEKTKFKGLLDNYLEFLTNLPLRNILDSDELREVGEKAQSILAGVTSEALIENTRIRDYVENEMSGIATKLDTIINLRPTRAFEAA